MTAFKTMGKMSRDASCAFAVVCTVPVWFVLFIESGLAVFILQLMPAVLEKPGFNIVALIVSGVVASGVGLHMAYFRRRPFLGALLGLLAGTAALVVCLWLTHFVHVPH